ncbi:unnamed protein product [Ilex paraguariensis]|uniref:Auxin-responsive protein n=1 Tax=Ilex paraguariensis TaxID=185542 RepID=A0ABC8SQ58_9AQUA
MRQQLMQLQQPVQYLQHSGSNNLLLQQQQQQQVIQQSISPHMLHAQNQMLPENLFKPIQVNNRSQEQEQQHTYQEAHLMQSDQLLQRQPSNLPSPSFSKTDFTASNTKFPTSIAPPSVQNMLGSLCREGSGNLLNFSRTGHSMLSEQPPQLSWVTNFAHQQGHTSSSSVSLSPYPGKDAAVEQDTSSLDAHNQALYSANIDSSGLLLPTTVSSVGSSAIDASISSMPLGASAFQSSLYGYMEDSSELLHSAGQVDPQNPTRTFVKVYKSGSVGRSLDITRFTSYHELREELGQMFGIEGLLENPQRSGWQLVFVDRENDVLLLGDDPWDVQNMLGSLCREGSGNLLNFSRTGQSMLSEQPPQLSWVTNFAHQQGHTSSSSVSLSPYPGKDAAVEQDTSSLDAHNQALYSANIDSSGLLLPTTVSSVGSSAIDASISSMPLGASAFQSSLYGYMEDSSELLHSAGQVDPQNPTRTFVKVYKSGSVGRSLDITRFTSYHELREELGQMFGIEGLLENPQRSGWQLVFVDRENDVLLLGDDPWEAFVNNVWYIKILSPEDVLKLGKQEAESLSQIAVERMNSSGTDSRDLLSGLPSLGSLEY